MQRRLIILTIGIIVLLGTATRIFLWQKTNEEVETPSQKTQSDVETPTYNSVTTPRPEYPKVLLGGFADQDRYIIDPPRVYRDFYNRITDIPGADPYTIEVVRLTPDEDDESALNPYAYLKDKNSVYIQTTKIEDADPATFKVLPDTKVYSADKHYVFVTDVEADKIIARIIKGADPRTFKPLKEPGVNPCGLTPLYSTDQTHVFYLDKMVPGADKATFTLLTMGYAKDANNVYKGAEIVFDADPATFEPPVCPPHG